MTIAIASDHGGFLLKSYIKQYLTGLSFEVLDFGTDGLVSVDYPFFAQQVARAIQNKEAVFGVLVCSTGVGVAISANRFHGVRAVNCCSEYLARMSREHNAANVICFGEKFITFDSAQRMLDIFFNTSASSEVRHQHRIEMIDSP